ncbi:MAG: peptide deformylase [Planctomycetota bacterium]|jgi:peptide deformylase
MTADEKIRRVEIAKLRLLYYPDPRLREVCTPVEVPDEDVRKLTERMFELMFAARGIGLAAPQVGVPVRLFVVSPRSDGEDRRVYINPRIISADGSQQEEEGCLSFPGITCKLKRYDVVTIRATGLDAEEFEETCEELTARIFQHEIDHLDGRLLVDRMSSVAKLANRGPLRELEEKFAETIK